MPYLALPPHGEDSKQSFVIEYDGAIYFTHGAWKFSQNPADTDPGLHTSVEQLKSFLNGAVFRPVPIEDVGFAGQSTTPIHP